MDDTQYEELCRRFIAEKENLPLEKVRSVRIPSPRRGRLPAYGHQIDLYWETESEVATYINIANAKWRASGKIHQGDVELLQQVRQKVAAHKAILITNTTFTAGAIAAAKDEGIALHVVRPDFEDADLPDHDRAAIQASLAAIKAKTARSLWTHQVEHKGLGFDRDTPHLDATVGSAPESQPRPSAGPLVHKPAHPTPPSTAPLVHKPVPSASAPPAPPALGGGENRAAPEWGPSGDRSGGFTEK
jgi:hypothetical protein